MCSFHSENYIDIDNCMSVWVYVGESHIYARICCAGEIKTFNLFSSNLKIFTLCVRI